jgi:hypothetical protein
VPGWVYQKELELGVLLAMVGLLNSSLKGVGGK